MTGFPALTSGHGSDPGGAAMNELAVVIQPPSGGFMWLLATSFSWWWAASSDSLAGFSRLPGVRNGFSQIRAWAKALLQALRKPAEAGWKIQGWPLHQLKLVASKILSRLKPAGDAGSVVHRRAGGHD